MSSELERRGFDCEIYAVGSPGASTYDEFLWLRDTTLLEDIQPDLIIVGYFPNDPDLASVDSSLGFALKPRALKSDWLQRIFPGLYEYVNWMAFYNIGDETGYAYIDWEKKLAERENLENYNKYVLQPMGEFIRERGIPLIVLPTLTGAFFESSEDHAYYENICSDVLPLFEQAGFPTHSPLGEFAAQCADPKYRSYFFANRVNGHPGPAVSWFLGRYAADMMIREYSSIIGKNGNAGERRITINDWMPYWLLPQAIQEGSVSQYTVYYPAQNKKAISFPGTYGGQYSYDGFLRFPSGKKYVKLNFETPVKLSCVTIEGEDLLSAELYTLGINEDLGFDDQKPANLGKRRGTQCTWADGSGRYVTSLLLSAKTRNGAAAPLTITIQSDDGKEAYY